MSAITDAQVPPAPKSSVKFDKPVDMRGVIAFLAVLAGGLFFMAYSIYHDIADSGAPLAAS